MNAPIIDTKCSSCRRPYRGRGEWDLVILANKLVGTICPRCVETEGPDRRLAPAVRVADPADSPSVEKEIGMHRLSPLVHLLSQTGRGLTLQLDQAQISIPEHATELGHTLLLLGQLLNPTSSSTPELKEGPGLNAA